MSQPKRVLILSREDDAHILPIAHEIRNRGAEVCHFDGGNFPLQSSLNGEFTSDGWTGTLTYQQQHFSLEQFSSIWWRRPQLYVAPESYTAGERAFLEEEAYRAMVGLFDSLSLKKCLWVSRTNDIRRAELRVLQLAMAQQVGLRIPRTLITNEPEKARRFYEACQGNIILKPVSKGTIKGEKEGRFIYTSRVLPEHLDLMEGVRATAHVFQEHIPKILEIRVTVIGRQVFAAEIYSQHSPRTQIDFRRSYEDLTYGVHHLPDDVREKVLLLVRRFNLQFSSMDFLLTSHGEYVFLDLNPNGQFLWLQHYLADRLPLKEAMAHLLVFPEDYCL